MTPEEQFIKIENALRHAAEIQAQHAEAIAQNAETIAQHAAAIAQDRAAIRDLIAVSRTLLDTAKIHGDQIAASNAQIAASNERLNNLFDRAEEARRRDRQEFDYKLNALLQAQAETEQKLQRWIDRQGHA